MNTPRILGIDPGLRVTGFSSGRAQRALNRLCRLACTEADHARRMRLVI
jgi:Holliday junction resolvasome RuvABC endonuclease subunit